MNQDLKSIHFREKERKRSALDRLMQTMEELRALCPWDKKQTWESLRPLTLEEVYELADAIEESDAENVAEELGDVLLHIVFYAKIAEEQQLFDLADVAERVCDKLVERHPHIYGDVEVKDEEDVKRNWEQIKMKSGKKRVLSGVPASLPAIIKAYRMQQKTGQVGFEWERKEEVWEKVQEEMAELRSAQSQDEKEEEFGDLLFSLINYARYEKIDPELALARTNRKFKQRFEFIEDAAPRPLEEMSLEEMDALWNQAKTKS